MNKKTFANASTLRLYELMTNERDLYIYFRNYAGELLADFDGDTRKAINFFDGFLRNWTEEQRSGRAADLEDLETINYEEVAAAVLSEAAEIMGYSTTPHGGTIKTETYNGYSNYETWNLKWWIDKDHSLYEEYRFQAREILDSNQDRAAAVCALRDLIEENTADAAPDLAPSFYSDILAAGIGRVDFYEIAETIIDEVAEE